ncbi:hypothetical protein, conserved [Leishmania tarentolae]|uniref:Uncharacterized protein n=1 Tax=Leishmania tarentolae TaxID=5689 RepID=A0A640KPX8_LEITA|nr:hypothetical protein, conserved [Leishmania tarentolae]GET94041.1 hypothetical protein, conserved [Leishmania tarentolae]
MRRAVLSVVRGKWCASCSHTESTELPRSSPHSHFFFFSVFVLFALRFKDFALATIEHRRLPLQTTLSDWPYLFPTKAMSLMQLAMVAMAACLSVAAAKSKEEFPLVWVCLGITVVGVIVALYVAYKRPDELHLPGSVVMTAMESDAGNRKNATEPI